MRRVICITGGASGLGRELAAFFSFNSRVIIIDNNPDLLEAVANKFDCDFQLCDVSDYKAVSSMIKKISKKYHRIDCFINSAGLFIDGEIESNDPDLLKKVFEVNSIGPAFVARSLVPVLKKQKFGTIININSTASLHPKAFNSIYHSSKWALSGLSQSLQPELASYGIKVIDINPGAMKTKFTSGTNYDLSNALDPHQVVKVIDFILSLDKNVIIPQLTIKHL